MLSSGCSLFGNKKTYDTPIKTSAELGKELAAACDSSVAKGQPMLIEFSATWCGDCQKLSGMKKDAELAAELKGWDVVVINVGQFDQHTELLEAYRVNAIANWAVVAPADCGSPATGWALQAQRTLEPKSGAPVTSVELATWLRANRGIQVVKADAKTIMAPPKVDLMTGVTGIQPPQVDSVAAAQAIDDKLGEVEPEQMPLEDFAAEGAMAQVWRNEDGKWVKLVVESKGETYDSRDSVYAVDGKPFFARRFYFSDPSKFDEEGSETYVEAVAARATESTLFFFAEGRVVGVSTTGRLPASRGAAMDDGSLVEPAIGAVYPLDPTGEDFRSAEVSIGETIATIAAEPAPH